MNPYPDLIIDEAKHPANFGQLKNPDLKLVEYNASCGDQVTIELKIQNQKIIDLKWRGNGCIISLAAASVLSQKLIGMNLAQVKKIKAKDILNLLGLKTISPGRIKCLTLALKAISQA